jgi:hypothetical protein
MQGTYTEIVGKLKLFEKIKEFWWTLFCIFLFFALFWIAGAVLLEIYYWGFDGVLEGKFWLFLGEEMILIACVYLVSVCLLIKLIFR